MCTLFVGVASLLIIMVGLAKTIYIYICLYTAFKSAK